MAFVHIGKEERAKQFFEGYGLADVPRFADPQSLLYEAFGLRKLPLGKLVNLATVTGGLRAVVSGNRQGRTEGDILQRPGAFLVYRGEVVKKFVHDSPADKPDYLAFAEVSK